MADFYTLKAERGLTGRLTIAYPTKEYAVDAAKVIRHLWDRINITGPDGTLVLKLERGLVGSNLIPFKR